MLGFSQGGVGRVSGVVRECSRSKCVCIVATIVGGGCDVISFVVGSRMVASLGWSLALGWRPAEVFRLAW